VRDGRNWVPGRYGRQDGETTAAVADLRVIYATANCSGNTYSRLNHQSGTLAAAAAAGHAEAMSTASSRSLSCLCLSVCKTVLKLLRIPHRKQCRSHPVILQGGPKIWHDSFACLNFIKYSRVYKISSLTESEENL